MYSINTNFNQIFKAIGYKTRTDILIEIRKDKDMTLTKLSKKFKMSPRTLSFHIKELKNADIIISRKKKNEVFFSINEIVLNKAVNVLKRI